jgi:hypothetical protein
VTRREKIVVLLENYLDVVNGLRDRLGSGDHLPLMCRAYNRPKQGYPELEHLLGRLKLEERELHRHLAEQYARAPMRRVLVCPRCRGIQPTWSSVNFHKHGHSNVAVVPRVIRVVPAWVEQQKIELAIVWLDEQWHGEPFLPDELRPREGAAA